MIHFNQLFLGPASFFLLFKKIMFHYSLFLLSQQVNNTNVADFCKKKKGQHP